LGCGGGGGGGGVFETSGPKGRRKIQERGGGRKKQKNLVYRGKKAGVGAPGERLIGVDRIPKGRTGNRGFAGESSSIDRGSTTTHGNHATL